jgi:hypothetical protein
VEQRAGYLGVARCARLNIVPALNDHLGDPDMQAVLGRYLTNAEPGLANLQKLAALS